MYEGSIIFNFFDRLKEISEYTGLTKKTLKKHVNQLIEDKVVSMNGKHLVLVGKEKLKELFGLFDQKYFFKVTFSRSHKSKDIKDWLRLLVIEENKTKQYYALKHKDKENPSKSLEVGLAILIHLE